LNIKQFLLDNKTVDASSPYQEHKLPIKDVQLSKLHLCSAL